MWNGNIGTLTAKPTNNPAKIQICVVRASSGPWARNQEKAKLPSGSLLPSVTTNIARNATSISAEPNIV